jgi:hypothetical protein
VNGVSPYPRWTLKGFFEDSKLCPRKELDGDEGQWIELYGHYTAGHLYRSGGIEDQPAIYMQVMRLIDGAVKQSRDEESKRIHG